MAEVASAAITISKEGIESAKAAIEMIDFMQSRLIPWDLYEDTINVFQAQSDHLSKSAAPLCGEVATKLANAKDQYKGSVSQVVQFCQFAPDIVMVYIQVLEDEGPTEDAKNLIVELLQDGVQMMQNAQTKLGDCSQTFNETTGKLVELDIVLKDDFSQASSFFQSRADKVRKEAYGAAAVGVLFPIVGLAISYGIAVAVVEGDLIPKMQAEMEATQKLIQELQRKLSECSSTIDETKKQLQAEINKITDVAVKAKQAKVFVSMAHKNPGALTIFKKSADNLTKACKEYVSSHEM